MSFVERLFPLLGRFFIGDHTVDSLHGIFATYFLGFNNNMQDDTSCCDIDIACIGI